MEFNSKIEKRMLDKNSRNQYPLSNFSINIIYFLKYMLYCLLFSFIFEIILLFLKKGLMSVLDKKYSIYTWIYNMNLNSFFDSAYNLFFNLIIIALILYIILVIIRRSKYFEFDVIKNDLNSIFFKKELLKRARFNQEYSSSINDVTNRNEKRRKLKINKSILDLKLRINSRMSLDDDTEFNREFNLIIKRDKEAKINNELEKVINDFDFSQILHDIAMDKLDESIAFSSVINLEKEYRIFAVKSYSKEYLKRKLHISFEDEEEKDKTFHFSMPLSLIEEDSSSIIKDKKKKVIRWSKTFEKNISFTMNSSKERATLNEIQAGDTSVIYLYTLPQNTSFSVGNLEEKLQNNTKIKGITAKLEAGMIKISVPVPPELSVPVDFVTLLESTFGRAV